MTYRLRNILLAVGLAGMAAALTSFYVASYKRSVQSGENNVTVWVAKGDIEPGTPGSEVAKGGLVSKSVVRRSVVPGAISDPQQIQRLVATERTYANEQVSLSRFHSVRENGVRAELDGNVRAVQVSGDPHQLLAGTLKRGDRVDVIGNFKVKRDGETEEQAYTRTVLRDLLVLKPPNSGKTAPELAGPTATTSVQLAVTDGQAQKLFFTLKNGEWHLGLRAVSDSEDSPETVESVQSILCDGMPAHLSVCRGR